MTEGADPLLVADAAAWRAWLDENELLSDGTWLVLAKKGTTSPTSLTYAQALDEALCSGWIDGQKKSADAATYRQRFTPRRVRSLWSVRNIANVERLIGEGRMRTAGFAEIARAKEDGRWDAAYAGPATIEVPEDLTAALGEAEAAQKMFETLNSRNRYAILHRVITARNLETRRNRIDRLVGILARGETPYPQ